jgi:hypothetical protein
MPTPTSVPHKPMCHDKRLRNATLSADGCIRYGICAGCGVPVLERVQRPKAPTRRTADAPDARA